MMIASAKMVLFVAQIIAPLEVEVILVLELIVAQKCQVFLCYFNVLDSYTGLLIKVLHSEKSMNIIGSLEPVL